MMTESERVSAVLDTIFKMVENGQREAITRLLGNYHSGTMNWYYTLTASNLDVLIESNCASNCGNSLNTESISVFETVTKDRAKYYLHFRLNNLKDIEIFSKLIQDLFDCAFDCSTVAKGLSQILSEFLMWKSMLKHRGESRAVVRGVIGELWTILKLLESGRDAESVINAWTGPDYAKQDFMFEDIWVESKMVGSNAAVVRISSLGQLDNPDRPGFLCVVTGDDCDDTTEGAVTFKSLYNQICALLEDVATTQYEFKKKVSDFEYNRFLLSSSYACLISGEKIYMVKDRFPRLFNSAQMPGIKNVHYQIELSVIEQWLINEGVGVWHQE